MAFTATIQSINLQNDEFIVAVTFNDGATGFVANKVYNFDSSITQATLSAQITSDGTALKANLSKNNTLQGKVGTLITI